MSRVSQQSRGGYTLPLHAGAVATGSASIQLLARLRELKQKDDETRGESSLARTQWLESVQALLDAIGAWMLPAVHEGLARIDRSTVQLGEAEVGTYDAPALKISLPGGRIVWVRPVGTLHVGARGIVDLVCGPSRALVVLNCAGLWKIRSAGASSPLVLLDGQTFAQVLGELIL
jgi:hypothetical protein